MRMVSDMRPTADLELEKIPVKGHANLISLIFWTGHITRGENLQELADGQLTSPNHIQSAINRALIENNTASRYEQRSKSLDHREWTPAVDIK